MLLPLPKKGAIFHFLLVCLFVCLFVCQSTILIKKLWTDFHETWWVEWMRHGTRTNRLDFGTDLNPDLDLKSVFPPFNVKRYGFLDIK